VSHMATAMQNRQFCTPQDINLPLSGVVLAKVQRWHGGTIARLARSSGWFVFLAAERCGTADATRVCRSYLAGVLVVANLLHAGLNYAGRCVCAFLRGGVGYAD